MWLVSEEHTQKLLETFEYIILSIDLKYETIPMGIITKK